MGAVLIVIAIILAFCLGVGGYTFFAACSRRKEPDWLKEADDEHSYYYKYRSLIKDGHEWLLAHHAQDHYIMSRDGLKLHALWVPAENPRGTVLLVHGYHSGSLVDFSMIFDYYHEMGMNLLMPDHRAHGTSEGKFITFGVKESRDMLEWAQYHNQKFGEYPLIYNGLSMGAATVMFMADEELPKNSRGIVADCGFTSPGEIISKVFKQQTHVPAWPFIWATALFARVFAGFGLWEKSSIRTLAHSKLPVVLIHGLADDFVPCDMTKRSYEACTAKKELLLVEGAGHAVSYLKAEKEYRSLVTAFLERVLEDRE